MGYEIARNIIELDIPVNYNNLASHFKDLKGMKDDVNIKSTLVAIENELGYLFQTFKTNEVLR